MTAARRLHLVRPRRSVIVDLELGQPVTAPWSIDELLAMHGARVPQAVMQGMWLASWARAIDCGLVIAQGCLTPGARHEATEALCAALGRSMGNVIGSLFVAVPLSFDEDDFDPEGENRFEPFMRRRRAKRVGWPHTWGASGKWGAN